MTPLRDTQQIHNNRFTTDSQYSTWSFLLRSALWCSCPPLYCNLGSASSTSPLSSFWNSQSKVLHHHWDSSLLKSQNLIVYLSSCTGCPWGCDWPLQLCPCGHHPCSPHLYCQGPHHDSHQGMGHRAGYPSLLGSGHPWHPPKERRHGSWGLHQVCRVWGKLRVNHIVERLGGGDLGLIRSLEPRGSWLRTSSFYTPALAGRRDNRIGL